MVRSANLRIVVPDSSVAALLRAECGHHQVEVWEPTTSLDADSLVLLPHPPHDWQIEALEFATGRVTAQLVASGVDHLHGRIPPNVTLVRAPHLRSRATAEVALALALMAMLRADLWMELRANREWQWLAPAPRLVERQVFVLGRGPVGSASAELFTAAGARVESFGRSSPGLPEAWRQLGHCEILVIALPLVPQTNRLIDASVLRKLPDRAIVINVARGPIIDTDALIDELESGRLLAGLDVYDREPLPRSDRLWRTKGVILSPHVGGNVSVRSREVLDVLRGQLDLLEAGTAPRDVVDGYLYRW